MDLFFARLGAVAGIVGSPLGLAVAVAPGGVTPDEFPTIMFSSAAYFAVMGAALLWSSPRLWSFLMDRMNEVPVLERAEARDVGAIYKIGKQLFGENITPKDQIKKLLYRNRDTFWVLLHPNDEKKSYTICGYMCLIPIDQTTAEKIKSNEFDVTALPLECVPRKNDTTYALYVGAVAALTRRSKGILLGQAIEKSKMLAEKAESRTVFARAATTDGLRVIRKHDFIPVIPSRNGIGSLFYRVVEEEPEVSEH